MLGWGPTGAYALRKSEMLLSNLSSPKKTVEIACSEGQGREEVTSACLAK